MFQHHDTEHSGIKNLSPSRVHTAGFETQLLTLRFKELKGPQKVLDDSCTELFRVIRKNGPT